jgi:predicted Rossmann-fold nucleotide-binding protein
VTDFFPRLQALTAADAFVVLRGGIGTLTEATLAWSLLQTGQIGPRPFLFVGEDWRHLFEAFRATTFIAEADLALATVVGRVEEAVAFLRWALSQLSVTAPAQPVKGEDQDIPF